MILSVAIVAKDEEKYLENLFQNILDQTYSLNKVELILIDSMSKDNTFFMMEKFQEDYIDSFLDIRVLKNKKITQAAGWNLAIAEFKGASLTRIDGHSCLENNFLEEVEKAFSSGEDIVGGPRPSIIESSNNWNMLLYHAENSMFGSGLSSYRKTSNQDTYKKSMFHASYKKESIKDMYFDESLGRTEDNDFHYRLRRKGYKLFFTNNIVSYQYVRPNFRKMLNQKYSNGFWVGRTLFIQRKCLSIFYFIPNLFFLALLLSTTVHIFGNSIWLTFLFLSYTIFTLIPTINLLYREGKVVYILLPIVLFCLHISYGIGTSVGIMYEIYRRGSNYGNRRAANRIT